MQDILGGVQRNSLNGESFALQVSESEDSPEKRPVGFIQVKECLSVSRWKILLLFLN